MLSDSEHKMSVVVLFGGMSSEHEVSRVSAFSATLTVTVGFEAFDQSSTNL